VEHFITHTIVNYGYLAVFVLMVAESALIPIPSEVTMLFGGALANSAFIHIGSQHLNFLLVGLLGTVGNVVGSLIAYAIGRVGGRPLVERFGRLRLPPAARAGPGRGVVREARPGRRLLRQVAAGRSNVHQPPRGRGRDAPGAVRGLHHRRLPAVDVRAGGGGLLGARVASTSWGTAGRYEPRCWRT